MKTSLLLVSAVSLSLIGTAFSSPTPAATPNPDAKDAHKLLAEVRAARGAIARGERHAALDIVTDALAVDRTLAKGYRAASLGTEQGTFERIETANGAPVVAEYDRVTELGTLDLRAVRTDLVKARVALMARHPAAADQALARIDKVIHVESNVTPDGVMRAEENLGLSRRELRTGNVAGAKAEADAAAHDIAALPSTTK